MSSWPQDQRVKSVVVHAGTADIAAMTRQVENLHAAAPDAAIDVVALGAGIDMALAQQVPEAAALRTSRVRQLLAHGVRVLACANTMRSRGLTASDLISGVSVVPSGVAELASRQWDGAAYLRL